LGVELEWVLKEIFLSGAAVLCDVFLSSGGCGDGADPPGKGLRTTSPDGRGFLAGLAVIESDFELEEGRPSLDEPDGRGALPFIPDLLGFLRMEARRLGLTRRVTIRLGFLGTPESVPKGFSTLGRFGAGL
jgi:hypothetical protein